MFRKLFSYDMRAVKPIFKLQALISLILSVFCGLAQRRLNYGRMDDTYQGLLITFVSLCFVWFFASYVIAILRLTLSYLLFFALLPLRYLCHLFAFLFQ